MLGAYRVENGELVFRPRYPVGPGVGVRAVFRAPSGAVVERTFAASRPAPRPEARVTAVRPSVDVIPENQLKFYIEFSAPMSRGEAWERIRLLGPDGEAVDLPFLEIDQELWDRDHRRLTVLFDPGRIKRGVLPLEETGPAIEEGGEYTLVIDQAWLDARGAPLVEGHRKKFRVGAADREPPDTAAWRIRAPKAGGRDPLVVEVSEPMDYALLLRLIAVEGPAGRVRGEASVDRGETRWQFVPAAPWQAGSYLLLVDSAMEDLAGNRIGRPFDVDVFERVTRRVERETLELPFRIRGE